MAMRDAMKIIGIVIAIILFSWLLASFSVVRQRCYTPYEGPGSTVCFYDLMYKKFPPPEEQSNTPLND
jgi:hypothetical protein